MLLDVLARTQHGHCPSVSAACLWLGDVFVFVSLPPPPSATPASSSCPHQNLFLYKNKALQKEAFAIIHQLRGLVNLGLNDVEIPRLPSRFTGDQRLYGLPRGKEERKNKGMSPVKVAAAAAAAAAAEAAAARTSGECTRCKCRRVSVRVRVGMLLVPMARECVCV